MPEPHRFFQAPPLIAGYPLPLAASNNNEQYSQSERLRRLSIGLSCVFVGLKYVAMCIEFTAATGSMILGIGIASLILASLTSITYGILSWLSGEDETANMPSDSPAA